MTLGVLGGYTESQCSMCMLRETSNFMIFHRKETGPPWKDVASVSADANHCTIVTVSAGLLITGKNRSIENQGFIIV